MNQLRGAAALILGLVLLGGARPAAAQTCDGSINFDDAAAPSLFANTSPLTNQYAGLGIHFSGPAPNQGGAILDQNSNFGVNARSGRNFLAFNHATYATGPETMTFDTEIIALSLHASGGGHASTFQLDAFDSSNNLLATHTVNTAIGVYGQLSVNAAGIKKVVFQQTAGPTTYVVDDLTWSCVPEPGSMALLLPGLAVIGCWRRRRSGAPA